MITGRDYWTNPSALTLGESGDPIHEITGRARRLALKAVDLGWDGPPFDPIRLAEILKFELVPNSEIRDARLVATTKGHARIEYNPSRPRGRVRYSIAHEIAHTLFADWAEQVRHRGGSAQERSDDWQLESLCNIAAAELLMPAGDCGTLAHPDADIHLLLSEQKRFDVSMEALLLRAARVRDDECAAICASRHGGDSYRVDYVVGSRAWTGKVKSGAIVPASSVINDCNAVGFTAFGDETWNRTSGSLHLDCVAIPPYPGQSFPRVSGMIRPTVVSSPGLARSLQLVRGDATLPRGEGPRIIAHIVNDQSHVWGGGGFAASLRRKYPAVQAAFRHWAISGREHLALGHTHFAEATDGVIVASMIAQHGFGPSASPRLRYEALRTCLTNVAVHARTRLASIHMPPIGTGIAGGKWEIVSEIVDDTLVSAGIPVTVYQLPEARSLSATAHNSLIDIARSSDDEKDASLSD